MEAICSTKSTRILDKFQTFIGKFKCNFPKICIYPNKSSDAIQKDSLSLSCRYTMRDFLESIDLTSPSLLSFQIYFSFHQWLFYSFLCVPDRFVCLFICLDCMLTFFDISNQCQCQHRTINLALYFESF